MGKVALVAGATGLVGKKVVYHLIENSDYERIVLLVRNSTHLKESKIDERVIIFERLNDSADFFKGVDEVFCCLGTTMKIAGSKEAFYKVDFTYVYEIAKMAKNSGVKTFVLNSALGADAKSSIFYNKVKGEIEDKIKELNFEKYIIVRPSLLLGDRKDFRLGEEFGKVMAILMKPIFATILKKYKPVKDFEVAASMIRAAKQTKQGVTILKSKELF